MEYVKGKLLGRGAFGTATNFGHNRDHSLPSTFAVKTTISTFGYSLQNEVYALSQLPYSPLIIRCLGGDCKLKPSTGDTLYNLFLDYISGDSLSDRCEKLDELTIRQYTREILEGLALIYRHGFVHCDVKPDNILLEPSSRIKIADFGFAKLTGEETSKKATIRGTPMYMSPKVVVGKEPEPASDVWSLGCTVIELVSGKPPWDVPVGGVDNAVQLLFKIGRCGKSPEIPPEISEEGRDFLTRCLERDPRERWTAEMLLHHEFVKQNGVDTASHGATEVSDRFLSTAGSLDSLCWSRSSCRSS